MAEAKPPCTESWCEDFHPNNSVQYIDAHTKELLHIDHFLDPNTNPLEIERRRKKKDV